MLYRTRYSLPIDVTASATDGKRFAFPVSYVSAQFIGAPEEHHETKKLRVVIHASDLVLSSWPLANDDQWIRVFFEFARRHLRTSFEQKVPPANPDVEAPTIVTMNYPNGCPFDPSVIPSPDGFEETIKIPKRMGF